MATWPTTADIKGAYDKLNSSALTSKVDRARARAIAAIQDRMATIYDVSTWSTSAPPGMIELCYALAYGYCAYGVHTGASVTATDQAGKDALDQALADLELYASGARSIVDSSGVRIDTISFTQPSNLLVQPIFPAGPPSGYGIDPTDAGEAMGMGRY